MRRLTIRIDAERLEDIRILAHLNGGTMDDLIREAIEIAFEDELDIVASERALEEAARDPGSTIMLEEYMERRSLAIREREVTP